MSRIRTIKPDFFKHEDLFDAEQAEGLPLRLAFAGLWTCCDREGRFEWRPRALKTDVLPYDTIDFSRVLDALERYGFVVRYEVDGKAYGYVPSFTRHQVINNREAESKLPAPHASCDAPSDAASDACATRHGNCNGEREGEREEEDGGGGSAGAREGDPPDQGLTDREQILAAMGVGPDGIVGPSSFIGGEGDMAEVRRWLALPGITMPILTAEIQRIAAAKSDGPAKSFRYYTQAIQRLSAQLTAPPLEPTAGVLPRASPPRHDPLAAAIASLEAQGRI